MVEDLGYVDETETTYGERAVELSFNPSGSGNGTVDAMKRAFAAEIDRLDELRTGCSGEKARLCSVAITEIQTAQMWAVKAATWRN